MERKRKHKRSQRETKAPNALDYLLEASDLNLDELTKHLIKRAISKEIKNNG